MVKTKSGGNGGSGSIKDRTIPQLEKLIAKWKSDPKPTQDIKLKITVAEEEIADRIAAGEQPEPEAADPFADIQTFRECQNKNLLPRIWYADRMVTPGLVLVVAKKSMGKTAFLLQLADAIAEGNEFLGMKTEKTKVLYVSFELDEHDLNERFRRMIPRSENASILFTWPAGDDAIPTAEKAIADGFRVLIFDTLLPLLPADPTWKLNEYADTGFYLDWRLLGKKNDTAIIASWHTGKTDRDDFFLSPIGSTGMVGQADSLISIDRKREDTAGKFFIGGNHTANFSIPFEFENGLFTVREGEGNIDRISEVEQTIMIFLTKHISEGNDRPEGCKHPEGCNNPKGCTAAAVSLAIGKSIDPTRAALNRLKTRGKINNKEKGYWKIEDPY